ncbi:hypothetical protein HPY28_16805 [Brevibacillus sp. HB1.2]|uniref:hypothetical protein n=1 Tax=Brevibacillus sp. HB1.2 TaxID=2738807 RepID=UPI00157565EC|nr:hypothetical protein [Brevibacillus sp. HB1.2]NTU21989.1 hypothetical protein [Brevibacillus sp. HB1.2]
MSKIISELAERAELVLTGEENKEDGIEIHSMHPIVFSSEKDMEITSDTKVEIKAKEAIYLMCNRLHDFRKSRIHYERLW